MIEPDTAPLRYQPARVHAVPEAVPGEFANLLSQWLLFNRDKLEVTGDGVGHIYHELRDVDTYCEHLSPVRDAVVRALPDAFDTCRVEPFDLASLDVHAALYHHRSFAKWGGHTTPGEVLAYELYLHAAPKMYSGGELEFLDGTTVEPDSGTLVVYDPAQRHRVNPVNCWSHDLLHGRWSLFGWAGS